MKTDNWIVIALFIIGSGALAFHQCTDAKMAKWGGYGDEFKVELLRCDGTIAKTWVSSGKVVSEKNSDGYFFNDKATGKLIEVSGPVIITQK